jgi:hypothetical protein
MAQHPNISGRVLKKHKQKPAPGMTLGGQLNLEIFIVVV